MYFITEKNIEKIALLLLSLATLSGGIAAFFQNDFGGKMQQNYILSIHTFGKATTDYTEALSTIQNKSLDNLKDDLLYYQWQNKLDTDKDEADYLFSRLSEGLQKDIEISESGDDGTGSYFDEQEEDMIFNIDLKLKAYEKGIADAEKTMLQGSLYNSKGDKMTLMAILMSVVLFIGGIASTSSITFSSRKFIIIIGYTILIFGWGIFILGLI